VKKKGDDDMKGIATHTTDARASATTESEPYRAATVKMKHLFSTGHCLETFLRDDGRTQVSWRPGIPPMTSYPKRAAILPHYRAALDNWHGFLGRETDIVGGFPDTMTVERGLA
jgi:hypothetical protein